MSEKCRVVQEPWRRIHIYITEAQTKQSANECSMEFFCVLNGENERKKSIADAGYFPGHLILDLFVKLLEVQY